MNRWLGAFVLLLGTATLARAQPYPEGWTRVRTRPAPPPREVLDRLNLDQAWRTYVPIDGRRDGFVFIQFIGRDMFAQTRSGLVALIDPETGVTRWRARVGKAYEPILPLTANSRSVYVVS